MLRERGLIQIVEIKILSFRRNHSTRALSYPKRINRMTKLQDKVMRNTRGLIQIKLQRYFRLREVQKCITTLKEKDFLKTSAVRCI